MSKTLVVATALQKAVLEQVLVAEITSGFWKTARPADHAAAWSDVTISVGTELGASGFDMPRNYNFVNPDFFKKSQTALMAAAASVNPDVTVKQLKKQLIALNQILGSRLKQIGGDVVKLSRGKKNTEQSVESKKTAKTAVRKVIANIQELTVSA